MAKLLLSHLLLQKFSIFEIYFLANGARKIETCPPCEQYINCFKISGNEKGNYIYVNNLRLWTGLFKILLSQAYSFIIYILQIKLVNINVSDIADGKPSIVLGLIWTIILYFQVSTRVLKIICVFSLLHHIFYKNNVINPVLGYQQL